MFSSARERRDQVEGLENEADAVAAQLGEPGVVQLPDIVAANRTTARMSGGPGRPCNA